MKRKKVRLQGKGIKSHLQTHNTITQELHQSKYVYKSKCDQFFLNDVNSITNLANCLFQV